MRLFAVTLALVAAPAFAEDPKPLEWAGMKSTPPKDWKEETPTQKMRTTQYKLPKAEKDKEDAELAVFTFDGGAGTVEANLKRQLDKFVEEGRKDTTGKTKVGAIEATYQDVTGSFKKKAFPMATDFTKVDDFRQLYIVFDTPDKKQHFMTLLGPKDTVEKHKKGFEEFLKNFK